MNRAKLCGVAMLCLVACDKQHPTAATLAPTGFPAVVNGDSIDADTIRRIASDRREPLPAARDVAVSDALLAAYGQERFGVIASRSVVRSVLARATLEDLAASARNQGPPTDAEVEEASQTRWWEIDQPPLLRSTHAVVRVKKPEDDPAARALANRIASAVAGISDAAAFRTAAKAVPASGLEVKVEDLEPVARDGRVVDPAKPPPPGSRTAQYAQAFVDAAYSIPKAGGQSPVVRSEFGYHVILRLETIPEHRLPLEERRQMLASMIMNRRAENLRNGVLTATQAKHHVDIERSAPDLTERVKVSP